MTDLFSTDIILETEKFMLRPLNEHELESYIYYSETQPDTWKYSFVSASRRENMTAYVNSAIAARKNKTAYAFSIFDKSTGKMVGSTCFYDVNLEFAYLQLGYTWYAEEFRGSGINTHCKYLLLKFAFEELNIERVEFRADAKNDRSIAAMKKIGCTVEGIMRSHMPNLTGGRRDSIVLSILKNEWEEKVKRDLEEKISLDEEGV